MNLNIYHIMIIKRKIRGIWKIKKRAINKANEISVLIERTKILKLS